VAGFVGSPPMSLLSPRAAAAVGLAAAVDERVGVRAEAVTIRPGGTAVVDEVEDLGHELHVVLDVGGDSLVARMRADDRPAVGSTVDVAVDERGVRVFGADGRAVR
jgi:ABC-type sugar transport system ATPase subunit